MSYCFGGELEMTITADEFFGKDLKVYDTKMTENKQPKVISFGVGIFSDENGNPQEVHLSDKEKLTEIDKTNEPVQYETPMTEIEKTEKEIAVLQKKLEFLEKTEKEIAVLQKKLDLLKEIETHKSQPKMEFDFGGKFEVVSYNNSVYYRLEFPDEFYWYKKKYSDEGLLMVAITDGETHRLLEGVWFNDVRKGKYD